MAAERNRPQLHMGVHRSGTRSRDRIGMGERTIQAGLAPEERSRTDPAHASQQAHFPNFCPRRGLKRTPSKVGIYHAAARGPGQHPNSRKALEENRGRTQFNGSNPPPRCAAHNCNRWAWKKSPKGYCWACSGLAGTVERKTPRAKHTRALRRARTAAQSELLHLSPDLEERASAARLAPLLADPKDFDRLQLLILRQARGMIDHRAYRTLLGDLCPSKAR